ncbi:hypothetical protein FRC02_011310 [Tulasnella sp. 418]|nr:hypothetical protein FRC02_011310 [Tulasnella sp. 418]
MYPVTCILNTTLRNYVGEAIKWKVTARSNWMLTHLLSGLDVCYLFWEAETQHKETISPVSPSSAITASAEKEINHDKRFVPGESKCSPSNSVMLSVEVVPIYFDKSFGVLGLHTEILAAIHSEAQVYRTQFSPSGGIRGIYAIGYRPGT